MIERKVKTTAFAALVTAVAMAWLLKTIPFLQGISEVLELTILGIVTSGVTWVIGFLTKHTARNDAQTRANGTSDNVPSTD